MKTIKYILIMLFFLPMSVCAEEINISIECNKDTYTVNEIAECTIISNSDIAYRSFQANIEIDENLNIVDFISASDNIEIYDKATDEDKTISLKATTSSIISSGKVNLGVLKIKINESSEIETSSIYLKNIQVFGGEENSFGNYNVSSVNTEKNINIKETTEEDTDDEEENIEQNYDEEEDTYVGEIDEIDNNPKTSNRQFIIVSIILMATIILFAFVKKNNIALISK